MKYRQIDNKKASAALEYRDGCLFWRENRVPGIKSGDRAGFNVNSGSSKGYRRIKLNGKTLLL